MRRFVGALLVGLGAVFAVLAIGLPLYVAPSVTKLPYDMVNCPEATKPQPSGCQKPSVVEAKQATYLQLKADGDNLIAAINTGDLRSTTEVVPQAELTAKEQAAGHLTDNSVIWDVYSSAIRVDNGETISGSSTELALDRVSGAAVDWQGQWISETAKTKDTSIRYSEQVYKFPFNTEQRDYKYFDSDLRMALPIKYSGVEDIGGVQTYHFVQQIPDTDIKESADNIGVLLGKFVPAAKSGKIFYRNTREVWVEPVTGAFLKVREQQFKELRPDVGSPVTLLKADFAYTAESTANAVKSAQDNGFKLSLVKLYLPLGAGALALVCLFSGVLLMRRRDTEAAADPSFEDGLAEARHGLRAG